MSFIKDIYSYREMIVMLIKRDLRSRYKGSILGFLWTFLNPLFQLIVYTLVFSIIMRAGYDKYYLFLFIALVPWLFFSTSIVGGAACIWSQKELVNKIYFPREVLPIAHVTCQLINMILTFVVVFAAIIVSQHGVNGVALLYLPIIIMIEYFFALGIAMIVSAITVFFRDVEYILGIVMMAWQFLSPVMYGIDMVPEDVGKVMVFNPMYSILSVYRDILYYKTIPEWKTMALSASLALLVLLIGFVVFERLKRHFSEEM